MRLGVEFEFEFPDADSVTNNKDALADMMAAFEKVHPDRGLLFVLDELPDYPHTRRDTDLILDLDTPDVGRLLGFQTAHFVGSESGSERLSDRMYALVLGSPTVELLRGFYQQALDRHRSVPHLRDVEDADVELAGEG